MRAPSFIGLESEEIIRTFWPKGKNSTDDCFFFCSCFILGCFSFFLNDVLTTYAVVTLSNIYDNSHLQPEHNHLRSKINFANYVQVSILVRCLWVWRKPSLRCLNIVFRRPISFITLLSVLLRHFNRRDFVMFNFLMRDFVLGRWPKHFHHLLNLDLSLSKCSFKWNLYYHDKNKRKQLKSVNEDFCDIWTCRWKSF